MSDPRPRQVPPCVDDAAADTRTLVALGRVEEPPVPQYEGLFVEPPPLPPYLNDDAPPGGRGIPCVYGQDSSNFTAASSTG